MEKRTGKCECLCTEFLSGLWLPYWGIIVRMFKALRRWVWLTVEKGVGFPLTMTLKGYENLHVSLKWFGIWLWLKIRGSWKSKKFYNQTIHGAKPVCWLPDSILGFFPNTDGPIAWPCDWLWAEILLAIFGLTPTSHHVLAWAFLLLAGRCGICYSMSISGGQRDLRILSSLVREQAREVTF